ncbi:hypothetical protein VTK73DRAFT_7071 [Phialemonium thermophilum]|uniref:DNA-directed RNA polymerase III RPC4 n=1 Tax=Phialemonium thermophilum TaxID=223376 RepID=A0ABR3WGK7_9PEZI
MPPRGGRAGRQLPPEASSRSATPAAASTNVTPTTSTTSGGAGTGTSASISSKFRPKANRRSEAERERIAQEQLRLQNKRIADETRLRARGRFRRAGGRGRGGFRDREATVRLGAAAAGPLGQGTVDGGNTHGGAWAPASRGFGGAGSSAGRGITKTMTSKYALAGGGIDDDDRINADELRGHVDDVDDEDEGASRSTSVARKKRPVMPIGIERDEPRDNGVTVATAADIEGQERGVVKDEDEEDSDSEDIWVDKDVVQNGLGTQLQEDGVVWSHAAPKPASKVKIETETGDVIETMEIDEIAAAHVKEPPSPETKRKETVAETGAAMTTETKKQRKKRPKKAKDPEEETIAQDLDQLLHLLTLDADTTQSQSLLEGNMFLFQLPPVLPPLQKASDPDSSRKLVKDEPTDDVVMLDQPVNTQQPPARVDLTGVDSNKLKTEDGEEEDEVDAADGANDPSLYKEGGYVGKLLIRKSGKIELSWGGRTLEMVSGTPAQYLTTAVLLEEGDTKARQGDYIGTAYGMGKIEGKFVLAPRWEEEEEWVVDPADLAAE